MKSLLIVLSLGIFIGSCGSGSENKTAPAAGESASKDNANGNPSYDPNRGEGKFTKVELSATLDQPKAAQGEKVYEVKCSSCHKTTDEKLVGPGWKGVTGRHSAEWIMNFVTNTDAMIDKDPKVLAMLEICLVRMPNQNINDDDARAIYEFMRKVDGVK